LVLAAMVIVPLFVVPVLGSDYKHEMRIGYPFGLVIALLYLLVPWVLFHPTRIRVTREGLEVRVLGTERWRCEEIRACQPVAPDGMAFARGDDGAYTLVGSEGVAHEI